MNVDEMLKAMTPEIHAALKRAVEIGKWPDGRRLSPGQREICMEAVITYDLRNLTEEQRVGYIDRGSKADGELCDDDAATSILKWADQ
ncbi:YeaC family protein [Litorivivens sp.]|uniref:YeaC family protein n=1 Tax=Litorivivens sp. TaxID=2020868 RepID=UPI003567CE5D